jgi:hypothetical protein
MVAGGSVEAGELALRRVNTHGETLDLPVPAIGPRLADPFGKAANNLDETLPLAGTDTQHRAVNGACSWVHGVP